MPSSEPFVCGLVLGAGGSKRLGRPKQLLPYGDGTLLGHVVGVARACGFDQTIVAIGGAADDVRAQSTSPAPTSSSTTPTARAARRRSPRRSAVVDPRCDVLVLMLGDQPGVTAADRRGAAGRPRRAPLAVCRYDDGRGHPIAFEPQRVRRRSPTSTATRACGGCSTAGDAVAEVRVAGPIPLDVDTPEDYRAPRGLAVA